MNAVCARIAKQLMITPSTSVCGQAIISGTSLQVPGSDSSALTTRYLGFGLSCGMKPHFMPVGKPAPPRPRRLEALTASTISSGAIAERLAQPGVPALVLVGRQRPGAVGVPVVGEDGGQHVGHFVVPSRVRRVVLVLGLGRATRRPRRRTPSPRPRGCPRPCRRWCRPRRRRPSAATPAPRAGSARSSRARGRWPGRPARRRRRSGPRRRGRRGSRRAPARPHAR